MISTRLPILTFHSMDEQDAVISFSPDLFATGISIWHQAKYQSVRLDALNIENRFSASTLVITFDDGYASVYRHAFPVLLEHNMTATIFLTVGKEHSDRVPMLNGREMLSWREIREMHAYGIEFGAHTLTHPDLTRLPLVEIETEMRESKERIEQILGADVSSFAYPFGRLDARSRSIAQKYFSRAVSDRLGWAHTRSDLWALERLDAFYMKNAKYWDALFTPWFRGYIFARRVPRELRRMWISR